MSLLCLAVAGCTGEPSSPLGAADAARWAECKERIGASRYADWWLVDSARLR